MRDAPRYRAEPDQWEERLADHREATHRYDDAPGATMRHYAEPDQHQARAEQLERQADGQHRRLEAAAGEHVAEPPAARPARGTSTPYQLRSNLLSMHATADRYRQEPGGPSARLKRQLAAIEQREAEYRAAATSAEWASYITDRDGQRLTRNNRQAGSREAAAELARLAAPEIAAAAAIAADPPPAQCPPLRLLRKPCPACGAKIGQPCPPPTRCTAPGCSSHTRNSPLCGFHTAQAAAAKAAPPTVTLRPPDPVIPPPKPAPPKPKPAARPATAAPAIAPQLAASMAELLATYHLPAVLDAAWQIARQQHPRGGRTQ